MIFLLVVSCHAINLPDSLTIFKCFLLKRCQEITHAPSVRHHTHTPVHENDVTIVYLEQEKKTSDSMYAVVSSELFAENHVKVFKHRYKSGLAMEYSSPESRGCAKCGIQAE